MYKIVVNKKMPTTCWECGLIKKHSDGMYPISTFSCEITGETIGDSFDCKETLPEWCPIENSVPRNRPKQSEEEKARIELRNTVALFEIAEEWGFIE